MWRRDFKTLILNISYTDDINDWQRINISTIQELCKMRDGILYSGYNGMYGSSNVVLGISSSR